MSELENKKQKHLDFLLADYNAMKSEIARRSNLQRVVLAAYIAAIVLVFKGATESNLTSLHIMIIWITSTLTLNYYFREGMEICRLGEIIKTRISPVVSKIIDVDPNEIFPSQTCSQISKIDNITKKYDQQFNWTLFFIVPLGITLFYFTKNYGHLENLILLSTPTPYMAIVTIIFSYWATSLLWTHVRLFKNS